MWRGSNQFNFATQSLASELAAHEKSKARPVIFCGEIGLEDLLLTLRQRNQAELQEQLGDTAWERLLAWAQVDSASIQTQAELAELWQVKQPSVSQTLQQLIEAGAVEALPRRGREAIQYLMAGTARLAF